MGWMSLADGYLDGNMMPGLSFENVMTQTEKSCKKQAGTHLMM